MKNITITEKAKDKISERLKGDFLRLSLSGGGCNGYQYNWDIATTSNPDDHIIDNTIVVDTHSMGFLVGTVIDWKETLVETGFEIHNPNEESACGCGVSVGFS
jgi:iron-sulfur cluster insertion protein|tara:strand:- start:2052 stop:2360 length:309 start_codon:yes stop_codon:yes gene_type:complete